ncbi:MULTISPECIES: ABC transporter permease [unclassified Paenibacillus]|uniref:ABC transporter permease n=1 Tax=unclassified Paenibacillus TaxID=185978 RepID=UPI0004F5DA47|nr:MULTISPECIES: ABC transporter permease [unclassified Paenibacillus]AIQ26134.1 hypothetical protein H70737_26825 [Paenibacillus sp. FSL H7-0737]KAA1188680.1 ABC transporter permease [Paenibacillus sp. B2(2019)]
MNILYIAYYTIITNVRDYRTFVKRLFMPLLITLILGTALQGVFEPTKLEKTSVVYYNADAGDVSRNFDEFLKLEAITTLLNVKEVKSEEEGMTSVKDGDASAFIYLNQDYSKAIMDKKKSAISIYSNNVKNSRVTIVQNIVDSFIIGANTTEALAKLDSKMNYDAKSGGIEEVPVSVGGKTPGSMDYYAVTMLMLTLMAGALYGSDEMSQDFTGALGRRLRSSPMRPMQHFVGKIIGCVTLLFVQAMIVYFFTKVAFDANWGANPGMIMLVVLTLAVLSTALGVMISMLSKDQARSTSILNMLVPIMTFIGGGYVKLDLEQLMYLSPNYLGQTIIFNNIYGGTIGSASCFIALWTIIAVIFIISGWGARRKLA